MTMLPVKMFASSTRTTQRLCKDFYPVKGPTVEGPEQI